MEKDFKGLKTALDKLASLLKKDDLDTFRAFLEYVVCGHSYSIKQDYSEYSEDVKKAFYNCYREYVLLMDLQINTNKKEWFDAFGEYFELTGSKWMKQKNGQFFTPVPICNFKTQIVINKDDVGKMIADPTCGSGRLLIASHAYNPRNYHYGMDIDYLCCLMSAVNMMMHGAQGEIIHCNSLDLDSYWKGWSINTPIMKGVCIPHIEELAKEDSFVYKANQKKKEGILSEKKQEIELISKISDEKIEINKNQTSFTFF